MKRCPASFIFDFDEEDTRAILIFTKDHEGKHEYIRRDLVRRMLNLAIKHYANHGYLPNDLIIDQIISEAESK